MALKSKRMYFLFSPPIKKEDDASVCTSYGRNLAILLLTVVLKAELLWRVTSKSLHQSVWLVARFSLSLVKFFHSPHSPPLSFELKKNDLKRKDLLNYVPFFSCSFWQGWLHSSYVFVGLMTFMLCWIMHGAKQQHADKEFKGYWYQSKGRIGSIYMYMMTLVVPKEKQLG